MKNILLCLSRFPNQDDVIFDATKDRDGINEFYIYLRESLKEKGYRLTTDKFAAPFVGVIFRCYYSISPFDFPSSWKYLKLKGIFRCLVDRNYKFVSIKDFAKEKRLYWCTDTLDAPNNDLALHDLFHKVLHHSTNPSDTSKYVWFNSSLCEVMSKPELPITLFSKKKLLVMINSNNQSTHPKEMYSTRRDAINCFEKHLGDEFDLYGYGWNSPTNLLEKLKIRDFPIYKSYRGPVESKAAVLSKYRFSLVIEPEIGEGLITEKIIDCLKAGCVPVYLGAPDIEDFVPANVFINLRDFDSYEKLQVYLTNMSEERYVLFVNLGQKFLSSEEYNRFSPENKAKIILNSLGLSQINTQ